MKYRQRLCEYVIKYGVTKAAKRYHTYRQFVYRQLEKYDGSARSLALRSRKPQRSPNAHTEEELKLIARALLPFDITEGCRLHYEMMQYTIID